MAGDRMAKDEGAKEVIDHTPALDPDHRLGAIAAFGQDSRGEVYVLDFQRGDVFRIVDPATRGSDRGES